MTCRRQHDTEPEERACGDCVNEHEPWRKPMKLTALLLLSVLALAGCVQIVCPNPKVNFDKDLSKPISVRPR